MQKGLVNIFGDIYVVFKGFVIIDLVDFGLFMVVFYFYFLDVDIKWGEKLDNVILCLEVFKNWKEELLKDQDDLEVLDVRELVD